MRPAGTHPVRTGRAGTKARLCAVLCMTQLAVAHAQPVAIPQPQPLWLIPLAGPAQVPVLPFPTPFWLWPVPWSMPLAPLWLPPGVPAPRPMVPPVPATTAPTGDLGHAAEPAAQAAITLPPPAADAATGSTAPATGAGTTGVPMADTLAGDIPATEVPPVHVPVAAPAAEPAPPQQAHPPVDTLKAESDAIPTSRSSDGTATGTVTTGTQAAEAEPPSTPTRKARPTARLKPLPPPKTLGSGARADTTRNGGKARKLCWRDGKLDVCP